MKEVRVEQVPKIPLCLGFWDVQLYTKEQEMYALDYFGLYSFNDVTFLSLTTLYLVTTFLFNYKVHYMNECHFMSNLQQSAWVFLFQLQHHLFHEPNLPSVGQLNLQDLWSKNDITVINYYCIIIKCELLLTLL